MTKVYVSSVVDAPVAEVWNVVRDFNALPAWAPFAVESRIEQNARPDQIGCIRNFVMKDGSRVRERMLGLSDYEFSCTYAILESPLGVENYIASLRLTPVTDGNASFVEWQADFDCPEAREALLIRQIGNDVFLAGLNALKKRFRR